MVKIRKQKSSKRYNRKLVLNIIRNMGVFTIAQLSDRVGLSKLTIQKIIDYYLEKKLVVNTGKGESTQEGGKKPNLYSFNPQAYYAVGFQLSPETLRSTIIDLQNNQLYSKNIPMSFNSSEDILCENISFSYAFLLESLGIGEDSIIGVGVGVPGVTNSEQGTVITSPHTPVWGENFELRKVLEERIFHEKRVFVDNSVRFCAFAEKMVLPDSRNETTVVITTGVGTIAGIILDNTIRRGRHHLAGHIGHMVIDPRDEEQCMCGNHGCFEVLVSTERLLRKAIEGYREHSDSMIFREKQKDDISVLDIFHASNRGDRSAIELMSEIARWFSIGIHNIVLLYDPDTIIIAGIYSQAGDFLISLIQENMSKDPLFRMKEEIKILYSSLGDDSAALGASAYVVERFFEY